MCVVYLWIPTVEAGHHLRFHTFKLLTHLPDGLLVHHRGVIRRVFWEQIAWKLLFKPLVLPDRCENDATTNKPRMVIYFLDKSTKLSSCLFWTSGRSGGIT